jgi:hypothetical protein
VGENKDAIEDAIRYVLEDDPGLDAESFIERVKAEVEHDNLTAVEDDEVVAVLEEMENDGSIYFDAQAGRWYFV